MKVTRNLIHINSEGKEIINFVKKIEFTMVVTKTLSIKTRCKIFGLNSDEKDVINFVKIEFIVYIKSLIGNKYSK